MIAESCNGAGRDSMMKSTRSDARNTGLSEESVECLKIVLFAANPFGDLKLDEEIRRIKHKVDKPTWKGSRSYPSRQRGPADLIDELNEHEPQIVQFSGHGVRGSRSP